MADQPIGKVVHYYDKIGVAVVKLSKNLAVGDRVRLAHGEDSFEQEVMSMQLDHESINEAKKNDEVAIKVDQVVKEGTLIYAL